MPFVKKPTVPFEQGTPKPEPEPKTESKPQEQVSTKLPAVPETKAECQAAMDVQHKYIEVLTERLSKAKLDLDKLISLSRSLK